MKEPVEMSIEELIREWGPIHHVTIGINGGFHSVSLRSEGRSLSSAWSRHDPRAFPHLMDGVTVAIHDPVTDNYACPKCGAAKGEPCEGVKTRHHARMQAARGR